MIARWYHGFTGFLNGVTGLTIVVLGSLGVYAALPYYWQMPVDADVEVRYMITLFFFGWTAAFFVRVLLMAIIRGYGLKPFGAYGSACIATVAIGVLCSAAGAAFLVGIPAYQVIAFGVLAVVGVMVAVFFDVLEVMAYMTIGTFRYLYRRVRRSGK